MFYIVWLYNFMIKSKAWENDISCSFVGCYCRLALAYEGLSRRQNAIDTLKQARGLDPTEFRITLALAKLLFKNDEKMASLALCKEIADAYNVQLQCSSGNDDIDIDTPGYISVEDAADAYYLAGWVHIHDDNHTQAYHLWKIGHAVVPSCSLLRTQDKKRRCWDDCWKADSSDWSQVCMYQKCVSVSNSVYICLAL